MIKLAPIHVITFFALCFAPVSLVLAETIDDIYTHIEDRQAQAVAVFQQDHTVPPPDHTALRTGIWQPGAVVFTGRQRGELFRNLGGLGGGKGGNTPACTPTPIGCI